MELKKEGPLEPYFLVGSRLARMVAGIILFLVACLTFYFSFLSDERGVSVGYEIVSITTARASEGLSQYSHDAKISFSNYDDKTISIRSVGASITSLPEPLKIPEKFEHCDAQPYDKFRKISNYFKSSRVETIEYPLVLKPGEIIEVEETFEFSPNEPITECSLATGECSEPRVQGIYARQYIVCMNVRAMLANGREKKVSGVLLEVQNDGEIGFLRKEPWNILR